MGNQSKKVDHFLFALLGFKRILLVSILALSSPVNVLAQSFDYTKNNYVPENSASGTPGHIVHFPSTYEPSRSNRPEGYPLLIFLHGAGERGNGGSELSNLEGKNAPGIGLPGIMKFATTAWNDTNIPMIVVSPQLPWGFDWNWGGAPADRIKLTYDYAISHYNVDVNRVYFTGLSLGAMGLNSIIEGGVFGLINKIAAIVPISGNSINSISAQACARLKDVGIWYFHGRKDGTFTIGNPQYSIGAVNECKAVGTGFSYNRGSDPYIDPWDYPSGKPPVLKNPPETRAHLFSSPVGWDVYFGYPGAVKQSLATLTIWRDFGHYGWNDVYANSHGGTSFGADGNSYTSIYQWMLTYSLNGSLPSNQAPVASAGVDKTIALPANTLQITGNGTDSDGTIASFAWTKVSGGAATLSGANTATLSLSGLVQGSYTFRLTVTDNQGATGSDDVVVTVNPVPNSAPVANAGIDTAITLPTNSLSISGVGNDSDGTIAGYGWTKVSGGAASLSGDQTATLSVTGLIQGNYTFRLTVTDNRGATGFDDINVTVNPDPGPVSSGDPSLSYAGTSNYGINMFWYNPAENPWGTSSCENVSAGGNTQLEFYIRQSGNSGGMLRIEVADQNFGTNSIDINSYAMVTSVFTKVTIPLSAFSASPLTAVKHIILRSEPNKSVEIKGVRFIGGSTPLVYFGAEHPNVGKDPTLIFNPSQSSNLSPVASAGTDKAITLPINSLSITGTATDPDGTIASYAWTKVSGGAANLGGEKTATLSLTGLVQGSYTFRLTVTDNQGATGSDDVLVTVIPAPNSAPIAYAGADQTITLPTNTLSITGSGADSDGSIASYAWTKVSGGASTLGGVNMATLNLGGLVQGTYTFRLTVTDNQGATGSDDVIVTVLAAIPVAITYKVDLGDNPTSIAGETGINLSQRGVPIALTNTNGIASGIRLKVDGFNATNPNGTTTPPSPLGISPEMSRDSFYGNTSLFNGAIAPTGTATLSGLSQSKKYTISLYASRMGVGDNRETKYVVQGKTSSTVYLNVANNTDGTAVVADLTPDLNGTITILISKGPNNTNQYGFFYLGGIIVQEK